MDEISKDDVSYSDKERATDEVLSTLFTTHDACTNLHFSSLEDHETHYIVKFKGGLGGRGKFVFYLEDVRELVKGLSYYFNEVWLLKWEWDYDDTFTLELWLRR